MSHQFVLLRYRVPKSAKILFTWVLVWRLDGQRGRRTLCPRYYDRSLGGAKRRHTMTMYWAGVVLWVQDSHVQKYLAIRTQNIVRPRPHQPPLFHYRPRSLISIPRSPLREEMCRDVLNPHRLHGHCNLLVRSPSTRYIQVHVDIPRKNQICPHWPIHHRHHQLPNPCVVERCQVTVDPVTLSCVFFYRPAIFVIFKVFVNVYVLVILEAGRPPHGPLPPWHLPNGENTKAWVLILQWWQRYEQLVTLLGDKVVKTINGKVNCWWW